MIDLTPLPDTNNDRIQLPFHFDVEKMREEITALELSEYNYYSVIPMRSPAYQVDASIPMPPPTDDYADGSWTDWLDTKYMKKCPYIRSVVDTFSEHTTVNLVRILRLGPGEIVKEHTDPTLAIQVPKSMIRLTVPIWSGDEVDFYLNDEVVEMQPGECWYLRLSDPHRVENHGTTDRINLTIDMIPNEWLTKLVFEHDKG